LTNVFFGDTTLAMLSATMATIHDPAQAGTLLDPMRMVLLERLREPDSAAGLARQMNLPRQKLNYHLRELEKAGLVELVEERRKGNCIERVVRATARSFVIDPAVLGKLGADPREVQDKFSAAYLIAVAARTIRDVAVLRGRAEKAGKRLATFSLQTEMRFASAADRAAFVEELTGEIARLAAKYHNEHAAGGRRFQFVLGGYPAVQAESSENTESKFRPRRGGAAAKARDESQI
jgi:DNA-binding transcriptional ArsR family regulator